MPRSLKPEDLKTGSGKRIPVKGTNVVLTGGGMVGAGPNIGEAGWSTLSGVTALPSWAKAGILGTSQAIATHVDAVRNAHPSGAISVEAGPLSSPCAQGAFNELAGVIPQRPPYVGEFASWTGLQGIPDWGTLKINDSSLIARGLVSSTNPSSEVYPYFYSSPTPLKGENSEFAVEGESPSTDWVWNTGIGSGTLEGTGIGEVYTGGFTRDGSLIGQEVMRTNHVIQREQTQDWFTGLPYKQVFALTGIAFPADRGVLALIHWPAGSTSGGPTVADFLAQDPLDRVMAAILLGQGILDDNCSSDTCDIKLCDGAPGGIFGVGTDTNNEYDPYAYPGQATGQYNLQEIHLGQDISDFTTLKAPWDDLNNDGNTGARRYNFSTTPAAGQVRWGTDLQADPAVGTLKQGIPILGATSYAYLSYDFGLASGHRFIGNALVQSKKAISAADEHNFFKYRLPYLKDYSSSTGLKWTPRGITPESTKETLRYFNPGDFNAGTEYEGGPALTTLSTAGNYGSPFDEDYYAYQVARYRQLFLMPSNEATGTSEEVGSYWLVHFKKEKNFESFVRDGIMPWHATEGYDLYGASVLDTSDLEADTNVVNEFTGTPDSPSGPAPDYGYTTPVTHTLKSTLLLDANLPTVPAFSAEYAFTANAGRMFCSGVVYNMPLLVVSSASSFKITAITISSLANTGWADSFRTDNEDFTSGVAPVRLSSSSPAFITFFPFAYGESFTQPGKPSAVFPLGAAATTTLSAAGTNSLPSRVEIPFQHCGSNASGTFTDVNGPLRNSAFDVNFVAPSEITFEGDLTTPSFSTDAVPRVFFRKPLGQDSTSTAILPYTVDDGHGMPLTVAGGVITQVLMHSAYWQVTGGSKNIFGNFDLGGAGPYTGYAASYVADKDVQERFLDETYRWSPIFDDGGNELQFITGYNTTTGPCLSGPGMGGWHNGPIEVPVQAGMSASYVLHWGLISWIGKRFQEEYLSTSALPVILSSLQVAGWPDRNPPLTDGGNAPTPSSGLLVYPQDDYTGPGVHPVVFPAQPDYSAISNERNYVRCFDISFSRSGTVENVAGDSVVTLRLDGISLADLTYTAPGPGRLKDNAIAVLIKVPGLTTWMDIGRRDGDGPSKQDALLDGAGCQVIGPNTLDGVDSQSKLVYCQVSCHVGPVANFFKSTGIGGVPTDEVPLLLKVIMGSGSADYNMDREYDGTSFIGLPGRPGVSSSRIRGLSSIQIIRPSTL